MSESAERDRLIERVREPWGASPAAEPDARAVARGLSAVWASPRPWAWRRLFDGWRMPVVSRSAAVAMTGVALVVGSLLGRAATESDAQPADPVASMGS